MENPKQEKVPGQDLYDIFVSQGILIVKQIASRLQGKSSIDSLGNALFNIVNKIETEGEKNGIQFPMEIVASGSNEILGYLLDQSKAQVNEQQIKAIIGIAVGKYVENGMKTGKLSKEEMQQLAQTGAQQKQPIAPNDQPTMPGV